MIKIFRLIVGVNFILFVLWAVMPSIDINWYDETTYKVLSYEGYGSIFELQNDLLLGYSIFWGLVNIGLFFFIMGSRETFFVLLLVNVIITGISGLGVYTSVESVLGEVSTLLYGIIITLLVMPGDIKDKFSKNVS